VKTQTESINLTLNSKDQRRLLDLVILSAYDHFWGLNPEEQWSAEILRRHLPVELDLEKMRKNSHNQDLDQQLKILEDYIKNVLDYPYLGDLGCGTSRFMEIRYMNTQRFASLAWNFKDSAVAMYVNLWRVVLGDMLPPCSEEEQSRLASDLPCNRKTPRKEPPEIENQILLELYPHFYELLQDQGAVDKLLKCIKEVAHRSRMPDVLQPTMGLNQVFGIDSLDHYELMTRFEEEIQLSDSDVYPNNDSLGEWARIIMTYRTI
jgi:acyl carrier protein